MATYQNMVDGALRIVGRLGSGDSPTSTENTDYLLVVKEMLDAWSAKLGPIFFETLETLTWTGGAASMTIGTGGAFNTPRPQSVRQANYRDVSGNDYPPLDLITLERYQAIFQKTLSSQIPLQLAYNPAFSSSLGTFYIWPVPASNWTFELLSLKPFTLPSALSDTVTLPPGFEEALRWNLVLRLAPENGYEPTPFQMQMAKESLWNLERNSFMTEEMPLDDYLPGASKNDGDANINLWTQH